MKICLVQSDIIPDNITQNLLRYETLFQQIKQQPDIIFLPEMFNCGFSPSLVNNAEPLGGESMVFLQSTAHRFQCDIVASLPVNTNGKIYNRLLWINKEEISGFYDKRHLYFGEEKEYCTPGCEKVIIPRNNVRFLPLICYDIRFPVWCRNRYDNGEFLYDCIVLIANFPAQRSDILQTLAQARAIENQSFVIVCNRIGLDGNGNPHLGKSMVINPLGKIIAEAPENKEFLLETEINIELLEKIRRKFPIYKDWDKDELQ